MPLDIPSERDVPTAQWQDTSPYVQLRDAAHRVVQALANRQSPQPLTYNSRNDLCNSIRILRSIIVLCDRRTLLEQPARPEPTRASLAEIQRLQDEVQHLEGVNQSQRRRLNEYQREIMTLRERVPLLEQSARIDPTILQDDGTPFPPADRSIDAWIME